jgi:predicted ester cyclase
METYQKNKDLILDFYKELEGANVKSVGKILKKYTSDDYKWFGVHPFNEQEGWEAVTESFWNHFLSTWSSVQRRMDIFIAGTSEISGDQWVMSMGHFMGLRDGRWLGIPATGKMAFLRYADFNCIRDRKICSTGFFCDIISVMNQAGINPLPPQTGASFIYPGPKTHDGLLYQAQDSMESQKTLELINRMINDLAHLNETSNDQCPPEYLGKTWHDDMIWYGPAGIGASYTIPRYQKQHQYPFRTGLKGKTFNGHVCRFAEGTYGGFFGWPNLSNSPLGGFLGLPANDIKADMRVVDVYRREGDKLAENWVIIDLLHWLKMQGLDILERTEGLYP